MFVKICNWYTHILTIIARNVRYSINVYSIVVIIFRVIFFISIVSFVKYQFFMTLIMVKIRIPAGRSQPSHNHSVDYLISRAFLFILKQIFLIFASHIKIHIFIKTSASKPHFIIFNEWKDFFICDSIYVSNYQKLLFIFHQQSHIITKQRKRGIRYNYICLFEIFYTLVRTKITASFQFFNPSLF